MFNEEDSEAVLARKLCVGTLEPDSMSDAEHRAANCLGPEQLSLRKARPAIRSASVNCFRCPSSTTSRASASVCHWRCGHRKVVLDPHHRRTPASPLSGSASSVRVDRCGCVQHLRHHPSCCSRHSCPTKWTEPLHRAGPGETARFASHLEGQADSGHRRDIYDRLRHAAVRESAPGRNFRQRAAHLRRGPTLLRPVKQRWGFEKHTDGAGPTILDICLWDLFNEYELKVNQRQKGLRRHQPLPQFGGGLLLSVNFKKAFKIDAKVDAYCRKEPMPSRPSKKRTRTEAKSVLQYGS